MTIKASEFRCPKCGKQLKEDTDIVYPTKPAARRAFCEGCGYEGERSLGAERKLVDHVIEEAPDPDSVNE